MMDIAIRDIIMKQGWATKFAEFDFGDGVRRPGVFTIDPAPADARTPLCVIVVTGGGEEPQFATRANVAAEQVVNIRIWDDKGETRKGLRTLAKHMYTLFSNGAGKKPENYDVALIGGTVEKVSASFPSFMADNERFPGVSINVTITVTNKRI